MQPGQKPDENFPSIFEDVFSPQVLVSKFRCASGDTAFPIDKIGWILSKHVYATSIQVTKPHDKASFQFYNSFRTMDTCAMNAEK